MHVEIQVALNFFLSFLYHKLPRRRVNQFGEELERALRRKFGGHWYPEHPCKGSAYRCLKAADPVLEEAAILSGMALEDILQNLPDEMSIWIDPGEVSYRLGEKGAVRVLYTEEDVEIFRTFNPEAASFQPIDIASLSISSGSSSPASPPAPFPTAKVTPPPLTFTTAAFAQTKFGSTKLKSHGKRQRMSPTEFSAYIKSRALQQTPEPPYSPQSFSPGLLMAN